jgi:hypothetical protein
MISDVPRGCSAVFLAPAACAPRIVGYLTCRHLGPGRVDPAPRLAKAACSGRPDWYTPDLLTGSQRALRPGNDPGVVGPRPRPYRALRRRPLQEASWGVGVAQVRPGVVPASVPPSLARPTMRAGVFQGGSVPPPLFCAPRDLRGDPRRVGDPRLQGGPVVSLRRVSPGDRGLTRPVRPPGPYSHALG